MTAPDFDPRVLAAMRRWPDVPAAFGWLRLSRRGDWYLIDRGAPGFDDDQASTGEAISNAQILAVIARNYAHDEHGRWFWQNGPQRAYVDIESAPWVLRVRSDRAGGYLMTHTGQMIDAIEAAFEGPYGELFVQTEVGPGVIHDLDLAALSFAETGVVLHDTPFPINACPDPESILGFQRRPRGTDAS